MHDERTRQILNNPEEQMRGPVDAFLGYFDATTAPDDFASPEGKVYSKESKDRMRGIIQDSIAKVKKFDAEKRAGWLTSLVTTNPDSLPQADYIALIGENSDDPAVMLVQVTRAGRLRHKFKELLIKIVEIADRFETRKGV